MSLPKHDLRIYLDADTKAELDAYAEALGVEDGMTFSEYVSGVLHADIESARAIKESLDQVFADGDTERDA